MAVRSDDGKSEIHSAVTQDPDAGEAGTAAARAGDESARAQADERPTPDATDGAPAPAQTDAIPAPAGTEEKPAPNAAFVLQLEQHIAFLNSRLEEAERRNEQTLAAARSREQELDRIRERLERDREKKLFQEKSRVFAKLLDPLDNLERCLAAVSVSGDVKAMQEGLALVVKAFQGALAAVGFQRFDPTGEPFDPQCHEAIAIVPAQESAQAEKVHATYLAGYRLDGEVIRHARVVVARTQN